MLTLFSIPKPFSGHVGMIQRNAIRSWRALPGCQVVLLGDDPGVEAAAEELGVEWGGAPPRSPWGTPYLAGAFALAISRARHDTVCWVNADILLGPDLPVAAGRLRGARPYLAVGERHDLDVTHEIDFTRSTWREELLLSVGPATPHGSTGIDYFMFPRASWPRELPQLIVGRPGWDNWMICWALAARIDLVNVSASVLALHQNHGYGHVPQGRGAWEGPEADWNRELLGGPRLALDLRDATHELRAGEDSPPRVCERSLRRWWRGLPARHRRAYVALRRWRRVVSPPGWRGSLRG